MMMAIFARHYINDSSCILHKKQLYVDGATNSGKITELGQTCCEMSTYKLLMLATKHI